jgi:hypothetical protein
MSPTQSTPRGFRHIAKGCDKVATLVTAHPASPIKEEPRSGFCIGSSPKGSASPLRLGRKLTPGSRDGTRFGVRPAGVKFGSWFLNQGSDCVATLSYETQPLRGRGCAGTGSSRFHEACASAPTLLSRVRMSEAAVAATPVVPVLCDRAPGCKRPARECQHPSNAWPDQDSLHRG